MLLKVPLYVASLLAPFLPVSGLSFAVVTSDQRQIEYLSVCQETSVSKKVLFLVPCQIRQVCYILFLVSFYVVNIHLLCLLNMVIILKTYINLSFIHFGKIITLDAWHIICSLVIAFSEMSSGSKIIDDRGV